ncbi:Hsp20/alpha crystallin family protein [Photobacterium sp.]|uniref:Hsp20/alpha crystallin family protein n=1 Tax=Photobacterium sp. TaxID=660 RepID=UPI00299DED1A|nr:Hsp20/alpha crystallin family protein [Photobacterium sp.]MDX1301359.1 Hsp20/alpha crystallin family protein [Photobacterium sp.]
MSLVPRDSWFDFPQIFDNAFPMLRPKFDTEMMTPRVDIVEKEKAYEITAELPGVNKKDVSLQVNEGSLIIEATTQKESEEKKHGKVIRQERCTGKFMRSFYLGQNIQQDHIHAEFQNGLLKVLVPKVQPSQSQATKIEVK